MHKIFMFLLIISSAALAWEVNVEGFVGADIATYLDEQWKAQNSANHRVELNTTLQFDKKASLELRIEATSLTADGEESYLRNRDHAAPVNDEDAQKGHLFIDGIVFNWEFTRLVSLQLGDLEYDLGQGSHYSFKHDDFATIMANTVLRGFGFSLGEDGQVIIGVPDSKKDAIWGYAGYRLPIIDRNDHKLAVKLAGDLVFKNGGRNQRYTVGGEVEYSRALEDLDYGIFAAAGLIPFDDNNTYTLLLEPSMSYKKFSLGASMYQAFLADKKEELSLQTNLPVQRYAIIEPSFAPIKQFAFGLAGEFHDRDIESSGNEYIALTPNFYLYPTPEFAFTLWTSYRWNMKAKDTFAVGLSSEAHF